MTLIKQSDSYRINTDLLFSEIRIKFVKFVFYFYQSLSV